MGLRSCVLALFFFSSCGGVHFDVDQALGEQRIPGSPLGAVLPSLLPNPFRLNVDLKAETAKRGTGPATAAFLKSLTLAATPAANPSGNFGFLEEVHVFIEAPALPKKEVALLKPVPSEATSVTFTIIDGVDLLPYVNAGASITTTATGTQPARDFTFDGKVVLDIRV